MAFMSRLTTTWWTLAPRQRTGGSGSSSVDQANAALAGVALHHVHRRLDAGVQVDLVPFALVDSAKSRRSLTIRSIRRRPSRVRSMSVAGYSGCSPGRAASLT